MLLLHTHYYNYASSLFTQTIEEQYPESAYKLTMRAVRFSDDNDCNDPAIHIKFQENLDAGWKIMLKDGRDKVGIKTLVVTLFILHVCAHSHQR